MDFKQSLGDSVLFALANLGTNLRTARLRRSFTIAEWGQRLTVCPSTVKRMERGDPNVAMGTYVAALVLIDPTLAERLSSLAHPDADVEGLRASQRAHPARGRDRRRVDSFGPDLTLSEAL